jgi:hypothetical protein
MTTFPGSPKLHSGGHRADPFCGSVGAADHFQHVVRRSVGGAEAWEGFRAAPGAAKAGGESWSRRV